MARPVASVSRSSATRADRPPALGQRVARQARRLDLLGQANLVGLGQQGVLPDIGEIEMDQVLVVALGSPRRYRHEPLARLSVNECDRGAPRGRAHVTNPAPTPSATESKTETQDRVTP